MQLIRKLVWFVFLAFSSFLQAAAPTEKPRYAPGITSIIQDHQYIQTHFAPIYWKISPYYLPQPTDASCSSTTAAMVINALRIPQMKYANQKLVTPESVVSDTNQWAMCVKQGGEGVSLDQLGLFLATAIKAHNISTFNLKVIHATGDKNTVFKFHQALVTSEKTGRTFVIVNFNQQIISGTESVGHFAPVGAYDEKSKRVLLMDPDREFFEPYWVSEELLLKGMTTKDSDGLKNRGFIVVEGE